MYQRTIRLSIRVQSSSLLARYDERRVRDMEAIHDARMVSR